MGRIFQPARRTGTTVPRVQSMKYKTGEAIVKGSLVVDDANGELVLCGADPASIRGVALEPTESKLGWGEPNVAETVFATGRAQEVSIAVADREQEFSGRMENAAVIVAPLQTHIGTKYGVANVAGEWVIDETETVNTRVIITDIVERLGPHDGYHLFKFLESTLVTP